MENKEKISDLDTEVEGDESNLDKSNLGSYSNEETNLKCSYGKKKKNNKKKKMVMVKDKKEEEEEEGDYDHRDDASTTTTIKAYPKAQCFGPQEDDKDDDDDGDNQDDDHDYGIQDKKASQGSNKGVVSLNFRHGMNAGMQDKKASQGSNKGVVSLNLRHGMNAGMQDKKASQGSNKGVVSSSYKKEGEGEHWSDDGVVHRLAQLYWKHAMTREERKRVQKEMQALANHDGHGSINLQDLLHASPKKQYRSIVKLFNFLDTDESGLLNLDKCITLHYLKETGYRICGSCSDPILSMGFTCNTCWKLNTKNEGGTFDLCLECYDSLNYTHPHHDFLDDRVMQIQASIATAYEDVAMAKCIVCGHYHTKNYEGYLLQGKKNKHLLKLATQDSSKEVDDYSYICEWCMIWPCNNCGKFFKSSLDHAKPRLFLTTNKHCTDCGKDGNLTDMEPVIEGIKNNLDLRKSCETCDTLINNGDLFKIDNDTSNLWKKLEKSVRKTIAESSIKIPSKPSWPIIKTMNINPKPKLKPNEK